MSTKLDLIISYNSAIRKIINSQVERTGSDNSKEPVLNQIQRRLKLSKIEDWAFICTALDTIRDTSYAMQNFVEFKIDGPTKYDNIGEKYLRLYGFLNAVYIQRNAIISISNIFHSGSKNEIKKNFDLLEITSIRHKLASHNAVYLNEDGTKDTFIYSGISLKSSEVEYISYINFNSKNVDLIIVLNQYITIALDVLDQLYEKLIDTLYKTGRKQKEKFKEDLNLLRIEKEGGTVIRFSPDFNIIITGQH